MFYASPFALSMKPKNSIHKTQILVRVFIGTFSFWPFFFLDFSPLAFTCLGAGMIRNKTKREENEYVVLYTTLNGGSLGSWIDEERSKVR